MSWAEINQKGVKLGEIHGLDQGEGIFIDKTKKEDWAEGEQVKYIENAGYYVTGYNSTYMAEWNVSGSTVAQLIGESTDFVDEMTKAWIEVIEFEQD